VISLIHVPYWGDATLLEILWLVAGSIAAIFTLLNIADSWKDHQLLKLIRTDPSVHDLQYEMIRVSANGRIESQVSRLAIALLIVATGIVGVITPNPLHGGTTATGLAVTVALVLIGAITAARSMLDYRQRNLLYDMATQRTSVIAARLRAQQVTDPDVPTSTEV
jgi:hypothetical protein